MTNLNLSVLSAPGPTNRLAPSQPTGGFPPVKTQSEVVGTLVKAVQETGRQMSAKSDREENRRLLETLKEQLMNSQRKEESVAAILDFLRSGQDASTGLAFRLGPNHALAEAPTLRAALLDWLGQLDRAGAAEFAVSILEALSSPEEYAVALRNFAQGRPSQRGELRDYFNRLLTNDSWARQPSAGFLESFDVVPHLADPAFVHSLSALLAPTAQNSLRHASLVALDRLVLANPTGSMTELLSPDRLKDQPFVRASFFARADIRDPGQREVIESYLLSSAPADSEMDKFIGLFPNANRFVSYNLLTDSGGRSLPDIAALDAASLEQVRTWLGQPRFAHLRPKLEQLAQRLQGHVDSAIRGGHLPRR